MSPCPLGEHVLLCLPYPTVQMTAWMCGHSHGKLPLKAAANLKQRNGYLRGFNFRLQCVCVCMCIRFSSVAEISSMTNCYTGHASDGAPEPGMGT